MNRYTLAALAALSAITLAPTVALAQAFSYSTTTGGNIPDNRATGINSRQLRYQRL